MNIPLTPEDIDRLARKRAGAKLGWYAHAAIFVVVNAAMFLLSTEGMGQRRWSVYPLLGWGLGLTCHGLAVWVLGHGSGLREHMVQKERERLRRQ